MKNQLSLNGWWQFHFDEDDSGLAGRWMDTPPADCQAIPVPSCWNLVFPDHYTFDGVAWYFLERYLSGSDFAARALLRFEGVNYRCSVFVNGQLAGENEGGFTPFAFDVTHLLRRDQVNRLAVRVDARHDEWTLPPRGVDWFNYNGIYRPAALEFQDDVCIDDYTLRTRLDGHLDLQVDLLNHGGPAAVRLSLELRHPSGQPVAAHYVEQSLPGGLTTLHAGLDVADPLLWSLGHGHLYTLQLSLHDGQGELWDRLEKRFGFRQVQVAGQKILLNGQEIKLVGCSRHEEVPLTGRTVARQPLLADYRLLQRLNANFVRMCHYPHSRLEHEVLNEMGMAAVSEAPLIFLHAEQMTSPEYMQKVEALLETMIRAEKNETGILFWGLFTECDTHNPAARPFVERILRRVRELDSTRPLLMASIRPLEDTTYDLFDVIGVNYWEGWYRDAPLAQARDWLTALGQRFPDKPLLITSHGWEGMYAAHDADAKIRWSEEGQAEYLAAIADLFMQFKNIAGEIVWTFADFHVSAWEDSAHPTLHRKRYLERPMLTNHKGLVDFYRRPKQAFYAMQEKFRAWQERVAPPAWRADGLAVRRFSERRLLGQAAACDFIDRVQALLAQQALVRVLFASAASQLDFIHSLKHNGMFLDWSRIHAFHLDEFAGAGAGTAYGFAHWLRANLIDALPFGRFEPLDGRADDLPAECDRYARLLGEAEIDLACIGIGENGHIAFNEPHAADFADPLAVKVVALDEASRLQQVRDGMFASLAEVPPQALTLTIPAILRAGHILCIVPGAAKSTAVWRALRGEIGPACPASILRRHPSVVFYLDDELTDYASPLL